MFIYIPRVYVYKKPIFLPLRGICPPSQPTPSSSSSRYHLHSATAKMKYTFLAVLSAVTVLATPAPVPTPPNIPSASTAQSLLSGLTVRPQGPQDGYSRDKFPHWITISGTCNTRETVLRRDGTNVQVDGSCAATSGSWFSPYDGATWTAASDVDIDHVVPLSNAWKSGAASWTTSQRQSFANDLSNPQLIAVTDNVNQAKGDQGPESWKPPLQSYWCTYSRMWIKVKSVYDLSVTSAEKSALTSMLNTC
ncbi:uncharacterized protein ARB_04619 [Trichophyton benhamiae CBS 112371]|uniref:uncharacterized protein n=1 Tax=Arthroderma benhamiae (strain ATCC MYA-4681 / CBS 112371) TaxID=663331 RepID=UPI0001CB477D|nr:uncharacterized protein ARB_04619 [Trichophyton benhamiae CBS 112371]EFE37091.1 hypothetical protein ARB_04619 [Trichophyton benhamiae CBS 112371]